MIAIIGGGIVGASVAYHLARNTSRSVRLFEKRTPGAETTQKSIAQFGFYGDDTQYAMKRYGMRLYNEFFSDARANPSYRFAGHLTITDDLDTDDAFVEAHESGGSPGFGSLGANFHRDAVEYLAGDDIAECVFIPHLDTTAVQGPCTGRRSATCPAPSISPGSSSRERPTTG